MFRPKVGILHPYTKGLVAFEHDEHRPTFLNTGPPQNKLLFIGGMGDGLWSIPLLRDLPSASDNWSLVEVLTSSSYKQWGLRSVKRDAAELGEAVKYFRNRGQGKVAIMGHSTGSQVVLQFLMNGDVEVDGAILQAPVSDREALSQMERITESIRFAKGWIREGKGKEIVPIEMRPGFQDTPISAERWFSITAPLDAQGKPQGAEDMFSSDIGDEHLTETFGKIPKGTNLAILYSGNDQFVPAMVDKEKLVARWMKACKNAGVLMADVSGIVPGANHNLEGMSGEVMTDLLGRVGGFLKMLEAS